jgi:hypothetical protein
MNFEARRLEREFEIRRRLGCDDRDAGLELPLPDRGKDMDLDDALDGHTLDNRLEEALAGFGQHAVRARADAPMMS